MKWIRYLFHYLYRFLISSNNYIIYEKYRIKYDLHPTFRFNGKDIIFSGEGEIKIGCNTYIGVQSSIQSVIGSKVSIGNDCAISHNVKIYTSNYNSTEIITKNSKKERREGDVIIGNNCWIGVNVLIIEGVTIGSNVVIGGNSVVTKNIQNNCVVGGIPAKVLKKNDYKK